MDTNPLVLFYPSCIYIYIYIYILGGLRSLCSPALYLAESLLALRARRALRAVTTALFGSVARQ